MFQYLHRHSHELLAGMPKATLLMAKKVKKMKGANGAKSPIAIALESYRCPLLPISPLWPDPYWLFLASLVTKTEAKVVGLGFLAKNLMEHHIRKSWYGLSI